MSIGVWNSSRPSQHSTSVSSASKPALQPFDMLIAAGYCRDDILLLSSLVAINSLLLILSGDVETNPGPITVQELDEALSDLVEWERFAVHLGISSTDRQIICYNHHTAARRKIALYDLWTEQYPNGSWNDIVNALRACKENRIAKKVEDNSSRGNLPSIAMKKPRLEDSHTVNTNILPNQFSINPKANCNIQLNPFAQNAPYPVINPPQGMIQQQGMRPATSTLDCMTYHIQCGNTQQVTSGLPYDPHSSYRMPYYQRINQCQKSSTAAHQISLEDPLTLRSQSVVSTINHQYKQYLQGCYLRSEFPSYFKYPSPAISEFINLVVVHKKSKEYKSQKRAVMEYKIHGKVADIKSKRESISINEIGSNVHTADCRKPCFVLIEGDPGVGKTTLAWELCKGWAEGRLLQEWSIVFLVQLREKKMRDANSIQSMIDPDNEYPGICDYFEKCNGKKLLLIFDGFDELSDKQQTEASLFMKILKGGILNRASIFVTSRPSATHLLPIEFFNNLNQHIEVIGFDESNIKQYVKCKFLQDPEILEAFNSYIESHYFIFTLMYVPLHCALVTDLYEYYWKEEEKEFAPKTLTQLYTCFICCLLQRPINSVKPKNSVTDINDLPSDMYQALMALGKLAAEGIEKKQYVFDNVSCNPLGLLQNVQGHCQSQFNASISFSFLHLTLQEYLAAFYWSKQHQNVTSTLFAKNGALPVEDYLSKSRGEAFHWPALHFYSGLTGVVGTPLEKIVRANQSTKYNYLLLLFESQDANNLISTVFKDGNIECKVRSHMEAYVSGYNIARSSSKLMIWEIEMKKSGFMRNLVNGIEHAKIASKGGVISRLMVEGSSDCDVFRLFNFLEDISGFIQDLDLNFKTALKTYESTLIREHYSFPLVQFSYVLNNVYYYEDIKFYTFVYEGLVSLFKTLRRISLASSDHIVTDEVFIDSKGLQFKNAAELCVNVLPNEFIIQYLSCICGIVPCPSNHPIVVVTQDSIKRSLSVHLFPTEVGYNSLSNPLKLFLGYEYNIFHAASSNFLYKDDSLNYGLTDRPYYQSVRNRKISIFFYNFSTNKWIKLSLVEISGKYNRILILVTADVVKLLCHKFRNDKNIRIQSLQVIGDSQELQTVVQAVKDTNPGVVINEQDCKLALEIQKSFHNKLSNCIIEILSNDAEKHTLAISGSQDIDDLDIRFILLKYKLINLTISSYRFPSNTMKIVHECLTDNSELKKLILDTSIENTDDARIIADVLPSCTRLEVVQFKGDDECVCILLKGLLHHKTLKTLIIRWFNYIPAVDVFIDVITTLCNEQLNTIVVEYSELNSSHIERIFSAVVDSSVTKEIAIRHYDKFDDETPNIIQNFLLKNTNVSIMVSANDYNSLKEQFSSESVVSTTAGDNLTNATCDIFCDYITSLNNCYSLRV